MAELLQLREMAEQMGLQGQEAVAFVRKQQEIARKERRFQRDHQREETQRQQELQRDEAQRQREAEAAA